MNFWLPPGDNVISHTMEEDCVLSQVQSAGSTVLSIDQNDNPDLLIYPFTTTQTGVDERLVLIPPVSGLFFVLPKGSVIFASCSQTTTPGPAGTLLQIFIEPLSI